MGLPRQPSASSLRFSKMLQKWPHKHVKEHMHRMNNFSFKFELIQAISHFKNYIKISHLFPSLIFLILITYMYTLDNSCYKVKKG